MFYLMYKYSISCRYRQEMVHIPMTIVVDAIVSLGKFPSFARQRDFRKEVEAAETPAGAEGAGRVPLKGAVSAADWG